MEPVFFTAWHCAAISGAKVTRASKAIRYLVILFPVLSLCFRSNCSERCVLWNERSTLGLLQTSRSDIILIPLAMDSLHYQWPICNENVVAADVGPSD